MVDIVAGMDGLGGLVDAYVAECGASCTAFVRGHAYGLALSRVCSCVRYPDVMWFSSIPVLLVCMVATHLGNACGLHTLDVLAHPLDT